jgi:hypothetical protein
MMGYETLCLSLYDQPDVAQSAMDREVYIPSPFPAQMDRGLARMGMISVLKRHADLPPPPAPAHFPIQRNC